MFPLRKAHESQLRESSTPVHHRPRESSRNRDLESDSDLLSERKKPGANPRAPVPLLPRSEALSNLFQNFGNRHDHEDNFLLKRKVPPCTESSGSAQECNLPGRKARSRGRAKTVQKRKKRKRQTQADPAQDSEDLDIDIEDLLPPLSSDSSIYSCSSKSNSPKSKHKQNFGAKSKSAKTTRRTCPSRSSSSDSPGTISNDATKNDQNRKTAKEDSSKACKKGKQTSPPRFKLTKRSPPRQDKGRTCKDSDSEGGNKAGKRPVRGESPQGPCQDPCRRRPHDPPSERKISHKSLLERFFEFLGTWKNQLQRNTRASCQRTCNCGRAGAKSVYWGVRPAYSSSACDCRSHNTAKKVRRVSDKCECRATRLTQSACPCSCPFCPYKVGKKVSVDDVYVTKEFGDAISHRIQQAVIAELQDKLQGLEQQVIDDERKHWANYISPENCPRCCSSGECSLHRKTGSA